MKEEYVERVKNKVWLALATIIHQRNLRKSKDPVTNRNSMKCHRCNYEYHLSCDCLEKTKGIVDTSGSSKGDYGKKRYSA